jgi:septum site-determining protein MinC
MESDRTLSVQIKGIRDGLLVTVGDGDWPVLQEILLKQIDEKGAFFRGARLALDVGNHILKAVEMGALRDQLSDRGVILWAVVSNSPTTEQSAQVMGLATRIFTPKLEKVTRNQQAMSEGEQAMFVHRTLRSGNKISYQGHIIVLGDINPGAEVVASGSVIVWGKLRGIVHAGAEGDEKAQVCALDMMPMQLRIADLISVSPSRKGKSCPEVVRVVKGQLIAEPWDTREGSR